MNNYEADVYTDQQCKAISISPLNFTQNANHAFFSGDTEEKGHLFKLF